MLYKGSDPPLKEKTGRQYYIDNLRTTVIMLVIMLHLAVTYSSLGLWYYNEKITQTFFGQIFFGTFQTLVQAFSMGLLFFIAGYFTPGSYERKGFRKFVIERFRRLGLPSLFYLVVITPFICWVEVPFSGFTGDAATFLDFYKKYLLSAGFSFLGIGPMWFAAALFVFSVIFAVIRLAIPASTGRNPANNTAVSCLVLIGLIGAISVGAFSLRLVFPIGSILWGMQLCFFSQYVIFFAAGTLAYHGNFLERIDAAAGKKWLAGGLVLGIVALLFLRWLAGLYNFSTFTIDRASWAGFTGGVSWKSISFAIWESSVAVALTVGLLTVFREKLNFSNTLTQKLSDSSFAVYMFHPPIIIAVTLAMRALIFAPVFKWLIASAICVPVCFLLAYRVLLRIPVLNKIL